MHSLIEAGAARVASGETTLQELERVIGQGHEVQPAAPASKTAGVGEHRVLVIDDDATHRRIARRLLEKADFEVVEALDGENGIDTLTRDTDFLLVLLDLTLPGKSGRDVFEWMRRREDLAEVPVVVLTATEDPETEAELMELGVDDYIRKPIEPRRFIARVRATLRRAAA
jgi:DNA-binding response OmpR family regulator